MSYGRVRLSQVIAIAVLLAGGCSVSAQTFAGSIREMEILKDERIVGFEIHFQGAMISSLPSLPAGWNLSIDNDASWNAEIKGSCEVGAAALDPDFFKNFVIIEKDKSLGLQFAARGEVIVTMDFQHQRKLSLGASNFTLAPAEARTKRQQR